jgi:hypothetical protein
VHPTSHSPAITRTLRRRTRCASLAAFVLAWLAGFLLAAAPAAATLVIPATARELLERSDVVVHGVVVSSTTGEVDGGAIETVTTIQPLRVVKGAPENPMVVRQLGGWLPDGRALRIWGRPEYVPGREVVVFAIRHPNGGYTTTELLLGKFEVHADEQGTRFAVPEWARLGQVGVVVLHPATIPAGPTAPDDGAAIGTAEPRGAPRALTRFLEDLVGGGAENPESDTAPRGTLAPVVHEAVAPGVIAPQWRHMDAQRWRYANDATAAWTLQGTASIAGGGSAEAAAALATWTDDPNSSINYTLGSGSTTIHMSMTTFAGCGWTGCYSGGAGVLACAGPLSSGTHTWRGEPYNTIVGGTVWVRALCSTGVMTPHGAAAQPTSLTLVWSASAGATGYEYCYDTVDNGACDSGWIPVGTAG